MEGRCTVTIRRRIVIAAACVVGVALLAGAGVMLWPGHEEPRASVVAPPSPSASPSTEADPYPADDGPYDIAALPAAQVYSIVPDLPVDDQPAGPVLPLTATAATASIPVFAAPGGEPVAQLAQAQAHDGTALPVIEQHKHWVRVLLPARAGLPSAGVVGQTTGWLRVADVTLSDNPFTVTVSLSAGTISVAESGRSVYESSGFGFGTTATPTPIGRTFVMTVFTDPAATYTRGNPTTALAVQSPTLDGFGGASVAVTAFHYHDARSGSISNGCIRVDAATAQYLASLPLGTPVLITE